MMIYCCLNLENQKGNKMKRKIHISLVTSLVLLLGLMFGGCNTRTSAPSSKSAKNIVCTLREYSCGHTSKVKRR